MAARGWRLRRILGRASLLNLSVVGVSPFFICEAFQLYKQRLRGSRTEGASRGRVGLASWPILQPFCNRMENRAATMGRDDHLNQSGTPAGTFSTEMFIMKKPILRADPHPKNDAF